MVTRRVPNQTLVMRRVPKDHTRSTIPPVDRGVHRTIRALAQIGRLVVPKPETLLTIQKMRRFNLIIPIKGYEGLLFISIPTYRIYMTACFSQITSQLRNQTEEDASDSALEATETTIKDRKWKQDSIYFVTEVSPKGESVQPRQVAAKYRNTIGFLVRDNLDITISNWKLVPKKTKKNLWKKLRQGLFSEVIGGHELSRRSMQ